MKYTICINCGKEKLVKCLGNSNIYCNQICQHQFRFKNEYLPKFYLGGINNRKLLKKILVHLNGNICKECLNPGIHNNKILVLQVDHIDGNAGNNMPDNLRLLCPNCHSQTDTFAAKNKGNGRGSRGINR
jgi:hypothetical protein